MALFVFVHGGGDSGATFALVSEALRARGHDAVAPDLPTEEPGAGLEDYAAVVSAAAGGREDVILVGHSLGGFAATLAAARMSPRALVLLSAMIPAPGESPGEWWENAGYGAVEAADDPYWHDVPAGVAERASARERGQEGKPMEEPWPLDAWPDVPTHFLLLRGDRCFPPDFMRPLVRERLGIEPEELDGGHMVMLSRPRELAERLAAYAG
jgi:pimeloyl-ACP methyl ester carboxylesterase